MQTLIVKPKNKEEFQLLTDLLKKMRIQSRTLSIEEQEDFGLVQLMKEADRTQQVTEEEIMSKLI